jgi:hypothetical protein
MIWFPISDTEVLERLVDPRICHEQIQVGDFLSSLARALESDHRPTRCSEFACALRDTAEAFGVLPHAADQGISRSRDP